MKVSKHLEACKDLFRPFPPKKLLPLYFLDDVTSLAVAFLCRHTIMKQGETAKLCWLLKWYHETQNSSKNLPKTLFCKHVVCNKNIVCNLC